MTEPRSIAFFVTPHGFGHAARAAAVMAALRRRRAEVELHVFTTVPRWFFEDSVPGEIDYYPVRTDVGLVQLGPLEEDPSATVAALEEFWSGIAAASEEVAHTLRRHVVNLAVSDIAPLGILAAGRAGVPSVLVENFTWDWIYREYLAEAPELTAFIERNAEVFARADLRIQAEPACLPRPEALAVSPVCRKPRSEPAAVRRALELDAADRRPLVLLTMGGMGWGASGHEDEDGPFVVVTLGGVDSRRVAGNRIALPDRSEIYPPDLVRGADLVVGKLGYSTVAECCHAGTRMAFLERPRFPESPVLAEFSRKRLGAEPIAFESLESGAWIEELPGRLARPRPAALATNGADEIAERLLS